MSLQPELFSRILIRSFLLLVLCEILVVLTAVADQIPRLSPDDALKQLQSLCPEATPLEEDLLKLPGELQKIFPGDFGQNAMGISPGHIYLFADQTFIRLWSFRNGIVWDEPYVVEEGHWSFAHGVVTLTLSPNERGGKGDTKFLLLHLLVTGKDQILLAGIPLGVRSILGQAPFNSSDASRKFLLVDFSYRRGKSISAEETPPLKAKLLALRTKTWKMMEESGEIKVTRSSKN